jgi:hypothetical protein
VPVLREEIAKRHESVRLGAGSELLAALCVSKGRLGFAGVEVLQAELAVLLVGFHGRAK